MSDRVGVMIVNWNAGQQLSTCVESVASVAAKTDLIGEIIIIDNASTDGSADILIPTGIPSRIVRNRANVGFAAACNQAARLVNCEYLLFLNPDTRLSTECIVGCLEVMKGRPQDRIGIVGVRLTNDSGATQRTCCRLPTGATLLLELSGADRLLRRWLRGYRMLEFDHLSSCEVDHVIGAFYFVRRGLFDLLNGFDERFFMYFEDLDFSWRARRAGWHTWFLGEPSAYHKGGGCSQRILARRLFYCWVSRLLFIRKHFRLSAVAVGFVGTLILEPLIRVIVACLSLSFAGVRVTVTAHALLLRSCLGYGLDDCRSVSGARLKGSARQSAGPGPEEGRNACRPYF